MNSALLLLHLLGMSMWFGGALAAMVMAFGVSGASWEAKGAVYRLLARVHGRIIAPGALLTVLTGFLLIGSLVTRGLGAMLGQPGIIVMQTAGLIAALLVLAGGLPTANKAARIVSMQEAEGAPVVARLRKRQALVSSSAGVLFLVALIGAVVLP